MKKLFFLIFLCTMCVACQQKQKLSREEYLVQRYFLGPMDSIIPLANGVNPYSLIVDYCSMNPIDSTISYKEDEPNTPYQYYGLNGKTLEELFSCMENPVIQNLQIGYILQM